MKRLVISVVIGCQCLLGETGQGQGTDVEAYWDFGRLKNSPEYRQNPYPESDSEGLRAFLVKGDGPNGTAGEFFAYYGVPEASPKPVRGYPAVLLVHGGGGTAFPNYVKQWVGKGFAVLALDWYNQRPACGLTNVPPSEVSVPRKDLPGGRRQDHRANVANMVLAHSLLRSMPEVDPDRTVFVGLSWGSWYGSAVTAVDPRFRGAIEIYCADWNPKRNNLVDGRFLPLAKCPMWWFVSTNDQNVSPDSSRAGWRVCGRLAGKTIVNDLPHSHVGFEFEGCVRMARHFACGEPTLPVLADAEVRNGELVARILDAGAGIDHAKIAWTESDDPSTHKREWRSAPAETDGSVVRAKIPTGARQAYLSAYGKEEGRYGDLCGSTTFVDLGGERPLEFRKRLTEVHKPNRRYRWLMPDEDEFAFTNGCVVSDADFADYLKVSMNVDACVGEGGSVKAVLDETLEKRAYRIEVGRDGVLVTARDARAQAQAFYHLEDLMNLRCAPFLRFGVERRRSRFSPRMLHSGYGVDEFPDAHLAQMAHYGFDAIAVFMKTPEQSESAEAGTDVNDIIRRAKAHGLDTYLYTKIRAFVHPDDPAAERVFAETYGRLARLHPQAKGIVFVGESCEFPSKDPRTTGKSYLDEVTGDTRPPPGWFPCDDYPQWVSAVKAAVHKETPDMEVVFWTYNWGSQPVALRLPIIEKFPADVVLQGTCYETAADHKRNGLSLPTEDYTISFPGPGKDAVVEAEAAARSGHRFLMMSNTGGLTWDFGCVPFEPFPYQWKRRLDRLVKMNAEGRLAGLMESHHYGWYPNFIAELAKEAFTEGGMPFDGHLRAIAVREFGEQNADRALEAWKTWSEAIADYPATNDNQYGPFRLGPAYPYNYGGPVISPVFSREGVPDGSVAFPQPKNVMHPMTWMCDLNWCGWIRSLPNAMERKFDRRKEVELLSSMADKLNEGARVFASLPGEAATYMANLGEYLARSTVTGLNVKKGYLAFAAGDTNAVRAIARDEYENAQATLPLLARDSRLGWEPSMGYAGGTEVVKWKLDLMRRVYGLDAERGFGKVRVDVSALPVRQRFVAEMLETRVRERVSSGAGKSFDVKYVSDETIPGEQAAVRVRDGRAEIRASRLRGFLAGTGNLLKSFSWTHDSFCAPVGNYDFKPAKSMRMVFMDRHFINWYMEAPEAEFRRYVDDLALDGYNAFYFQYAMPVVDVARASCEETIGFERISHAVCRRVADLDCEYGEWGGSNQMPMNSPEEYRAAPNTNPKCPPTGFNACPAKPCALEAMLRFRESDLKKLDGVQVGYLTHWPYDEGGCGCAVCRPWGGNGYPKLIEKFNAINKRHHPEAKSIVSTWFFNEADYAGLWKYLESHDWVDYVLADDFGPVYPEYPLKHKLPGRAKLITFPEISMWGRAPWGGYGATALPKFLHGLFRQSASVAEGFMCYSEGIYEDINKSLVVGFYINPDDAPDDILLRYGRYHFAGADPQDFVRLANLLETNHRQTLMRRGDVLAAKELAEKMDREMLPTVRNGWRWRLVLLRTQIDWRPENRHYDELVRLLHCERQLDRVLNGFNDGYTCPRYVPDGRKSKVLKRPDGDATEMLQEIFDDPHLARVQLEAGDWRHGPLFVRHPRFELVLDEGCRLSAPVTVTAGADGVTVSGDRENRVRVDAGAKNVVVDGRRFGMTGWEIDRSSGRDSEINRLDAAIEWAEQHMAYERVAFLREKLAEIVNEAK